VRIAHLVPDGPPADVCYKPAGQTSFIGPLLGGADAIKYPEVSAYLQMDSGQIVLRIVSAGAQDCSTVMPGLMDIGYSFAKDVFYTLAAMGEAAGGSPDPVAIYTLTDPSIAPASMARVRFVHAAPGLGSVDPGLGAGSTFTPVWTNVPFHTVAVSGGQPYTDTSPLTHQLASVRKSGSSADLTTLYFDAPAGAVESLFFIGKAGSAVTPLRVLVCTDNAPPLGHLSHCALTPLGP
jgi:hypothetical protein